MILGLTLNEVILFLLVLARVGTAIATFPVFSSANLPAMSKVGAAVFFSLILVPLVSHSALPETLSTEVVILNLCKEIVVGLILGFLSSFLFAAIELAGQLIAIQMGFSMANVIDPLTQNESTVVSQFYNLLAVMIFLALDGHHFLLNGLYQSYSAVPALSAHFGAEISKANMKMMSTLFISAAKIGAPVMVALLLTTIALGIISRALPQMNVFVVGMPLNIGMGLAIIAYGLPIFAIVFREMFVQFKLDFFNMLRLLSP
jgi:flagellar biosynthetic protein FliR